MITLPATIDDRDVRIEELCVKVRGHCVDLGASAELVEGMDVRSLLVLFAELLAQRDRDRRILARLMSEPPRCR